MRGLPENQQPSFLARPALGTPQRRASHAPAARLTAIRATRARQQGVCARASMGSSSHRHVRTAAKGAPPATQTGVWCETRGSSSTRHSAAAAQPMLRRTTGTAPRTGASPGCSSMQTEAARLASGARRAWTPRRASHATRRRCSSAGRASPWMRRWCRVRGSTRAVRDAPSARWASTGTGRRASRAKRRASGARWTGARVRGWVMARPEHEELPTVQRAGALQGAHTRWVCCVRRRLLHPVACLRRLYNIYPTVHTMRRAVLLELRA